MHQHIVDGVCLRLVRQSSVILKLKGNCTTFLAMQTTEMHE